MEYIFRALLALLTVCALLWLAAPAHATDQHFTSAQHRMYFADGWSPPPRVLSEPDTDWTTTSLPATSDRPLIPSEDPRFHSVVELYRIDIDPRLTTRDGVTYLYLPRWKTNGLMAVYADNELIFKTHSNISWNGYNLPLLIPLNDDAHNRVPKTLTVRLNRLPDSSALSTMRVGTLSELGWRFFVRDAFQVQLPMLSGAILLGLGLFTLAIWVRLRENQYLLLFLVGISGFCMTLKYYVGRDPLPVDDVLFTWFQTNASCCLILSVHFLVQKLTHRRNGVVSLGLLFAAAGLSILSVPGLWPGHIAILLIPLTTLLSLVIALVVLIGAVWHSWHHGERHSQLIALWCCLTFASGIHDWLMQNNHIGPESIFLTAYCTTGLLLAFTFIIYRRYIVAVEDLEQLNLQLEDRLSARERDLNASYRRLREIEHQQVLADERQRLMQDMHDGLGSSLMSALRLSERGDLPRESLPEVLKGCIDDLKLAIDSMEPVDADLLLLLANLRFRLGPRLHKTGIHLVWSVTPTPALVWLDPRSALNILRILQEGFTNVMKHTQATRIEVSTRVDGEVVVISLSDDGGGYDIDAAAGLGGRGLSNQRHRAQALGGRIAFIRTGTGICLELHLPLQRPGERATDDHNLVTTSGDIQAQGRVS